MHTPTIDWSLHAPLLWRTLEELRKCEPGMVAYTDQRAAGFPDEVEAVFGIDLREPATANAYLAGLSMLLTWAHQHLDCTGPEYRRMRACAYGITACVLPHLPAEAIPR